jgi:hypothetical protein
MSRFGPITEDGWRLLDEIHNQTFLRARKPPFVTVHLTEDLWKKAKRLVMNKEELENLLLEGLKLALAEKGR